MFSLCFKPKLKDDWQFATKNKINKVWKNPVDLATAYNEWDGIIITTSIEPTLDFLKIVAKSNKPILVEKPVSTSSLKLEEFSTKSPENIIVAYNRRHYNTVKKARDFVINNKYIRATMTLPEVLSKEVKDKYYPVLSNSVHGIDMLNFIFWQCKSWVC